MGPSFCTADSHAGPHMCPSAHMAAGTQNSREDMLMRPKRLMPSMCWAGWLGMGGGVNGEQRKKERAGQRSSNRAGQILVVDFGSHDELRPASIPPNKTNPPRREQSRSHFDSVVRYGVLENIPHASAALHHHDQQQHVLSSRKSNACSSGGRSPAVTPSLPSFLSERASLSFTL